MSLPTDAERLRLRAPPDGRAVMRQSWRHLGFLHWRIDPAVLAPLLPAGLDVDLHDGVAYLGVVPFTIPSSRAALPGLPLAPPFHEANLRTYVHRGGHDPGIWFFSLEAASRLAVAGARAAYHLPYFHARMSMEVTGDAGAPTVDFASRRRARGGGATAELRCRYRPTGPAAPATPGSLAFFLAERYLLYAWDGRALRTARVHHDPYPLRPGSADHVQETLARAAGLPATSGPPSLVHYADGVDVQIYRPHLDNAAPVR
jgi:uncharacterized protein YqjF (DUF2071 family)